MQRSCSFVYCFDFCVHLTRKLFQTPCRRSGGREAGNRAASIEPVLYCNYWQAKQTFHFPVISSSLGRQVNFDCHALSVQETLLLYLILSERSSLWAKWFKMIFSNENWRKESEHTCSVLFFPLKELKLRLPRWYENVEKRAILELL